MSQIPYGFVDTVEAVEIDVYKSITHYFKLAEQSLLKKEGVREGRRRAWSG